MGSSSKVPQPPHHPAQYVMINGKFDEPDDLPGTQMVDGKYTLAPLHLLKLNPEVVTSVGVVSGEKIPVITDRNPHLEVRA